jgi:ActR/RegA family two-component response regulator
MSQTVSLRCLIVDDSAAFLETATRMLQRDGFETIRTASTTAEALRSIEEFCPDVTLVDINLGEESGFDLVEELNRSGWCARSAVILISTHDPDEFADMVAASPALAFLPKVALSSRAIHDVLNTRGLAGPG